MLLLCNCTFFFDCEFVETLFYASGNVVVGFVVILQREQILLGLHLAVERNVEVGQKYETACEPICVGGAYLYVVEYLFFAIVIFLIVEIYLLSQKECCG